jgi:hypothetical protein
MLPFPSPRPGTFYSDDSSNGRACGFGMAFIVASMLFRKMIVVNEGFELSTTTQEKESVSFVPVAIIQLTREGKQTPQC